MRLLYVTRSWSSHDEKFVEAWSAGGVSVRVIFRDGAAVSDEQSSDQESTLNTRLIRDLEDFRPDVVHAGPLTDIVPMVMSVWSGPLIAMSWGFDLLDEVVRDGEAREIVRGVIARADLLFVDNDAPRRVAEHLGGCVSKIRQFPWGVDVDKFTPGRSQWRDERGWDPGDLVILCTRRHEAYYDLPTVVRGFIRSAKWAPELRLVLAGSGSMTNQLMSLVHAAGLENRVQFIGEISQSRLPDVYRGADLYLSASLVDGSSVSLLEAMASGVPVCVSDIEGNAQWVAGGKGVSFKTGSDIGLSRHLDDFVLAHRSGGDEWIRRAARARASVQDRADWKKTSNTLPGLALEAIANHQGGSA